MTILDIESILSKERGNGRWISGDGIACGKYMGALGFSIAQPTDDVKWLSAFIKLPAHKENYFKLFCLYGKSIKNDRLRAPHFWRYAWNRAAFRLTFQNGAGTTLDDLLTDYIFIYSQNARVRGNELKIVVNAQNASQDIRADWKENDCSKIVQKKEN